VPDLAVVEALSSTNRSGTVFMYKASIASHSAHGERDNDEEMVDLFGCIGLAPMVVSSESKQSV